MKIIIKALALVLSLSIVLFSFAGCGGEMELEYVDLCNGSYAVWLSGNSHSSKITIPSSYKGMPISRIESYYEDGEVVELPNVTSIIIPPSVKDVDMDTLSRLTKLKEKEDGVTYVADWAIDCDPGITDIVIREGTVGIAQGFLWNNSSAKSVTLPLGLRSISSGAFLGGDNLTTVNLNEDIEYIGKGAFVCCTSLKSVKIPSSIDAISCGLFVGCDALERVVVPTSVKSIRDDAFEPDNLILYYEGSEEEFALIEEIHCDCAYVPKSLSEVKKAFYSETLPEGNRGNYWFYIDGQPVLWSEY